MDTYEKNKLDGGMEVQTRFIQEWVSNFKLSLTMEVPHELLFQNKGMRILMIDW